MDFKSSGASNGTFSNNTRIDCSNWNKPEPIFTPVGHYVITVIVAYGMPIIVIFGIFGNCISIIILKESARRISSHLYLLFLAVFDTLSMISFLPTFWALLVLRPYYKQNNMIDWVPEYMSIPGFCEARLFISFFFRSLSIWTIVLFSLERFVAVVFPLKSNFYCSVKGALIAIAISVVLSLALNMPYLFAFGKLQLPCRVTCKANDLLFINRMLSFVFLNLIPAIIIIVCNATIIYILRNRTSVSTLHDSKRVRDQQRSITKRLLAVSTAFFVLTFPSLIIISIHTANELKVPADKSHKSGILADIFHISMLLFLLNLAINFMLYCLTAANFRKAAWSLIKCDLIMMRAYRRALETGSEVQERGRNQVSYHSDETAVVAF